MEPPPFINDDSTFFSYSLSEIWPLPPHFLPPDTDNNSTLTNLTIPPHRRKRNLSPNLPEDCCGNKHMKVGGGGGSHSQEDENGAFKAEQDEISVAGNTSPEEQNAEPPSEPPKQDYIHVRARRGQATDSHSLAERARREKISERMKILQDLVPGCNKVIGKALVLDEIINYVQSLQRQVEFLSLKLEAVTSRTNLNSTIECFPSKDVGAQPFDLPGIILESQAARAYTQGSQPGWLHMQIAGSFDKAT